MAIRSAWMDAYVSCCEYCRYYYLMVLDDQGDHVFVCYYRLGFIWVILGAE